MMALRGTDCRMGCEQYEEFYSVISQRRCIHYDYRDDAGKLFSTVAPDLRTARKRRDRWLKARGTK